ncbi:hypothetical protein PLEOSDRAFT_1113921 [Pleurotus ostreatus PC15]|uniref:Thioredoxin domain-containing protein n=1 Tax=Pleurotus ostreatus (strain PC15) TaxID=1137138 RepID=A0A067NKX2_PLEO1|nr:hypothetical protein PLEOSDRAFT_1113921 [Pleurotus ostreatus PC15]
MSSALSTPRQPRIKRKPAPSIDLNERYPAPDPCDPFAPLSVLRSKSSGTPLQCNSQDSFHPPVLGIYSTAEHFGARPSNATPAREGHYRTRSQSVTAFHTASSSPYDFWHQQSFILEPDILPATPQPPSLVQDDSSGTESELEYLPVHYRGRISQFIAPRRQTDRPQTADTVPTRLTKVPSLSPLNQPPSPTKRQLKANSTLLFSSKRRPRTAESSASSEADFFYNKPNPPSVRENKRRTSFSPLVNVIVPPSASSSYVHVSSPSESSTSYDPPSSSTSGYSVPLASDSPVSTPERHGNAAEWALPSSAQLERAGALSVVAQSGVRIPFSSIFAAQRTIVIFIRHFWCPNCQDYISQLNRSVDPDLLAISGMRLVIIGNGAPSMIAKYKQMLNISNSFEVFSDPSSKVYDALRMGVVEKGTKRERRRGEPTEYAKRGAVGGFAAVVFRALKVGLPLWEKGGDTNRLGGEFVLGPGNTCTYAHRMQSTRGHVPVINILETLGVSVPTQETYVPELDVAPTSCLGSPKEIAMARASMDVRPSTATVSRPSMSSSFSHSINRRSLPPRPVESINAAIAFPDAAPCGGAVYQSTIESPVVDIRREELHDAVVVAEALEQFKDKDLPDDPRSAVEVADAQPEAEANGDAKLECVDGELSADSEQEKCPTGHVEMLQNGTQAVVESMARACQPFVVSETSLPDINPQIPLASGDDGAPEVPPKDEELLQPTILGRAV